MYTAIAVYYYYYTMSTIERGAYSIYKNRPAWLRNKLSDQADRMKAWPPRPIKRRLARNILITLALGAGGALATMSVAGAVYFMIHGTVVLALTDTDYHREIKRLEKRGYVALTKKPEGFFIKLLKKAKRSVKKMLIEDIKLPSPVKWDGKWRLYTFDIPEKYKLARDLMRRKLKDLGMYNIQRSVFAYPYDCRPELEFISEHYSVSKHSAFMEVSYTDIDKELRRFFRLSRVVR